MLTQEEEKFLIYWEANREREISWKRQLSLVLPIGFVIAVAILANSMTGWYTRATMVANSQSTPIVLFIAIVLIALFCSIFYKRHRWEINDQHYNELLYKKNLKSKVQQPEGESSQENVIIK